MRIMDKITTIRPLLTIEDLSRILGYEKRSIYDMLYRDPETLPPLLKLSKKTRALRWHPEVVECWIREKAGLPAPSTVPETIKKRGPGRPRKSVTSNGQEGGAR
jgi:predicted DNA-binding transcriptional regulator AlpA